MNKGKIVQVMGPVVDVVFEDGNLPEIKDALEVENNGKRCVINHCPRLYLRTYYGKESSLYYGNYN